MTGWMAFKIPYCQTEKNTFDKQQDRIIHTGKEAEPTLAFERNGGHYQGQLTMPDRGSVNLNAAR